MLSVAFLSVFLISFPPLSSLSGRLPCGSPPLGGSIEPLSENECETVERREGKKRGRERKRPEKLSNIPPRKGAGIPLRLVVSDLRGIKEEKEG